MSKECPYCADLGQTECDAQNFLYCTRPAGHEGPHVACGKNDHELAMWDSATVVAIREGEEEGGG